MTHKGKTNSEQGRKCSHPVCYLVEVTNRKRGLHGTKPLTQNTIANKNIEKTTLK